MHLLAISTVQGSPEFCRIEIAFDNLCKVSRTMRKSLYTANWKPHQFLTPLYKETVVMRNEITPRMKVTTDHKPNTSIAMPIRFLQQPETNIKTALLLKFVKLTHQKVIPVHSKTSCYSQLESTVRSAISRDKARHLIFGVSFSYTGVSILQLGVLGAFHQLDTMLARWRYLKPSLPLGLASKMRPHM